MSRTLNDVQQKSGVPGTPTSAVRLAPCLTPHGRIVLARSDEAAELERSRAEELERAFERGTGHGLLTLGARGIGSVLPPVFGWWREFAARLVTTFCTRADVAEARSGIGPPEAPGSEELEALLRAAPMMHGAEYLGVPVLRALWSELGQAFAAELEESGATLAEFLKSLDPAWNVVGRVHFNLAENRRDAEAPFRRIRKATPYGVGARLDQSPELFFALRQVDEKDLIAAAGHALALPREGPAPDRLLAADGLGELFGLELAPAEAELDSRARKPRRKPTRRGRKKASPSPNSRAKEVAPLAGRRSRSRRGKKK